VMAVTRIVGAKEFEQIDEEIANMLLQTKPNPAPSMLAALRTAIVLGRKARGPAMRLWLSCRRRGSSERVQDPSASLAEIGSIIQVNPEARSVFGRITEEASGSPARLTDADVVSMTDGMLEEMSFWFEDKYEGPRARALATVFARRDEDWIVPIGYAAERANGSRLSGPLSRQVAFYDRCNREKRSAEPGNDMVVNMRRADEAGELATFANLVLADCPPQSPQTEELRFLLDCHDTWRRGIDDVIGIYSPLAGPNEPTPEIRDTGLGNDFGLKSAVPPPAERLPQPGPIRHSDDPQKERWGGASSRDGRQVRVVINSVERDLFFFSVIVESTDWTPLVAPVIFHLHDSFPRSVVTIRRIENGQAVLREWNAYGVFAIGVQLKNATGQWISLEIDLANSQELPKRFRDR
jgi:hypothetical protein